MTTNDFTKEIRYDRITRDYAVMVNGHCIGYARNYLEGDELANAYIYEQLQATA